MRLTTHAWDNCLVITNNLEMHLSFQPRFSEAGSQQNLSKPIIGVWPGLTRCGQHCLECDKEVRARTCVKSFHGGKCGVPNVKYPLHQV